MSWTDWTNPTNPWTVDSQDITNGLSDSNILIFEDDTAPGKKKVRISGGGPWASGCTYTDSTEMLTGKYQNHDFTIKLTTAGNLECTPSPLVPPNPLVGDASAAAPPGSPELSRTAVSWSAEEGSGGQGIVGPPHSHHPGPLPHPGAL